MTSDIPTLDTDPTERSDPPRPTCSWFDEPLDPPPPRRIGPDSSSTTGRTTYARDLNWFGGRDFTGQVLHVGEDDQGRFAVVWDAVLGRVIRRTRPEGTMAIVDATPSVVSKAEDSIRARAYEHVIATLTTNAAKHGCTPEEYYESWTSTRHALWAKVQNTKINGPRLVRAAGRPQSVSRHTQGDAQASGSSSYLNIFQQAIKEGGRKG